jgi:hypothetical protein
MTPARGLPANGAVAAKLVPPPKVFAGQSSTRLSGKSKDQRALSAHE